MRLFWQYLPRMRQEFPHAFPRRREDARPLAKCVVNGLAAAFGLDYVIARGIVLRWKLRRRYCKAVLNFDKRIALDGSLTDELVTKHDRTLAQKRLCVLNQQKRAQRLAKLKAAAAEAASALVDRIQPLNTP